MVFRVEQYNGLGKVTLTHYSVFDSKIFPRVDKPTQHGELRSFALNRSPLPANTSLRATLLGVLYDDGVSEGIREGTTFLLLRRTVSRQALSTAMDLLPTTVTSLNEPTSIANKLGSLRESFPIPEEMTDARLARILKATANDLLGGIQMTLVENPTRTLHEASRLVEAIRRRISSDLASIPE